MKEEKQRRQTLRLCDCGKNVEPQNTPHTHRCQRANAGELKVEESCKNIQPSAQVFGQNQHVLITLWVSFFTAEETNVQLTAVMTSH